MRARLSIGHPRYLIVGGVIIVGVFLIAGTIVWRGASDNTPAPPPPAPIDVRQALAISPRTADDPIALGTGAISTKVLRDLRRQAGAEVSAKQRMLNQDNVYPASYVRRETMQAPPARAAWRLIAADAARVGNVTPPTEAQIADLKLRTFQPPSGIDVTAEQWWRDAERSWGVTAAEIRQDLIVEYLITQLTVQRFGPLQTPTLVEMRAFYQANPESNRIPRSREGYVFMYNDAGAEARALRLAAQINAGLSPKDVRDPDLSTASYTAPTRFSDIPEFGKQSDAIFDQGSTGRAFAVLHPEQSEAPRESAMVVVPTGPVTPEGKRRFEDVIYDICYATAANTLTKQRGELFRELDETYGSKLVTAGDLRVDLAQYSYTGLSIRGIAVIQDVCRSYAR